MARKLWTEKEYQIMREKYPHMRTDKLAKELGRSRSSVYGQVKKLGLSKSKDFLASPESGIFIKGSTVGKAYRFPKGNVPANKGKKQSEYMNENAIARTSKTRFKKGRKPHNTIKGNGIISKRKDSKTNKIYNYYKISDGKWVLHHKYLWEVKNGKMPKGHCLWFKDGDSQNYNENDLSNLELITRGENAKRNKSSFESYPEDLKSTIKTLNKLKKIIRHEK